MSELPIALRTRAFAGVAFLQLVIAAALFVPARTLRYWQGWAYWCVFLAASLVITEHFLPADPDLIRRRLAVGPTAERRPVQKVVQGLASLLFLGLFAAARDRAPGVPGILPRGPLPDRASLVVSSRAPRTAVGARCQLVTTARYGLLTSGLRRALRWVEQVGAVAC